MRGPATNPTRDPEVTKDPEMTKDRVFEALPRNSGNERKGIEEEEQAFRIGGN